MRLDRVTITGADDSVSPEDLILLGREFPFVEWGILASNSQMGGPRFPSATWLQDLCGYWSEEKGANFSLHLCGRWLREVLIGRAPPLRSVLPMYRRAQLNFHGEAQVVDVPAFAETLADMGPEEFIFQVDGNMGTKIIGDVVGAGPQSFRCVPLFDLSHGRGVLPPGAKWPSPFDNDTYHGYAGGLGPDNLVEQIKAIGEAAGDTRIWIDMETKVRSHNDRIFDMSKVRECLSIAAPFVKAAP